MNNNKGVKMNYEFQAETNPPSAIYCRTCRQYYFIDKNNDTVIYYPNMRADKDPHGYCPSCLRMIIPEYEDQRYEREIKRGQS